MRSLPETSTHDQQWESNPRLVDFECSALSMIEAECSSSISLENILFPRQSLQKSHDCAHEILFQHSTPYFIKTLWQITTGSRNYAHASGKWSAILLLSLVTCDYGNIITCKWLEIMSIWRTGLSLKPTHWFQHGANISADKMHCSQRMMLHNGFVSMTHQ